MTKEGGNDNRVIYTLRLYPPASNFFKGGRKIWIQLRSLDYMGSRKMKKMGKNAHSKLVPCAAFDYFHTLLVRFLAPLGMTVCVGVEMTIK